MTWQVRNNRRTRPVKDPVTGIVLQGTVKLTDEQMVKLKENSVIAAMLGCDADGVPQGTDLLTVTRVEPAPVAAQASQTKKKSA